MMSSRSPGTVIDWSVLREIVGSNEAMRDRLLTSFMAESEHDVCALEAALDAQKFGAARSVAHQLKGAASTVGALSLALTAASLEAPESYGDEARLSALRSELRAQISEVHERIQALRPA